MFYGTPHMEPPICSFGSGTWPEDASFGPFDGVRSHPHGSGWNAGKPFGEQTPGSTFNTFWPGILQKNPHIFHHFCNFAAVTYVFSVFFWWLRRGESNNLKSYVYRESIIRYFVLSVGSGCRMFAHLV